MSMASRDAASWVSVVWMCASPVTMSWSDSVCAVVKSPNFFHAREGATAHRQ
ncbi:MAG: hypothetical protein ACSLE8_04940 [Rhodococcus sp. (in: high G+C Gram-positive bacteria)]